MSLCNISNCLIPTLSESLVRVRGDIRMGLPCLLTHQGTSVVMSAIETLTPERFDALTQRFGTPELVLTLNRAQAIKSSTDTTDIVAGPVSICPPRQAPLRWFQELSDTRFDNQRDPTEPFHVIRSSEMILQKLAMKLVKTAKLLPAAILFPVDINNDMLSDLNLTPLEAEVALQTLAGPPSLEPVASAALPLEAHEAGRLHIFRDPDGTTEHYAIEVGNPDRNQAVLSRLHSACFTGDVLGSLKCDCGPQLRTALARMGEEGAGVLLYLNQEGRGIGLANKMRVYDLQAAGLDTVEANHRLGYEDDERDFRVAAIMLRTLGFAAIRLLTNNPAKMQTFQGSGIAITEQLPLRVGRNEHNEKYLSVKAMKSGHTL